ncbi:MAG: membrane protein insertion efficiency factor YidD [bacterium]
MIRKIATIPIIIYQKTVSFDHGPLSFLFPHGCCRFYPSCSEYCRQAVLKHGIVRGYSKGVWRVLHCHPWTDGGIDKP